MLASVLARDRGRRCASVISGAAMLLGPSLAGAEAPPTPGLDAAPAPSAAALEREARQAYERREYAVAARHFESANRAEPHAALELNAGLAWEQAGDPERAADAYAAALALGGLDAPEEKMARARLAKLEQSLGTLILEGPASTSVRVGGDPVAALPARRHLSPGDHEVEALRADGEASRQRVTVRAGETQVVRLTAAQLVEVSPPPAPPSPPPPPRSSTMRVGGWVSLGAGVAFAGAAVGLGVATISTRNDYVDNDPSSVTLHDRAVALRALTNVAWGVAAASGITGVVLVIAAPRGKPSSATADVQLAPSGATLRLAF